jgi:hypothetical protein
VRSNRPDGLRVHRKPEHAPSKLCAWAGPFSIPTSSDHNHRLPTHPRATTESDLGAGSHKFLFADLTGQNRRIRASLMNVNDGARRSQEHIRGNGFNSGFN